MAGNFINSSIFDLFFPANYNDNDHPYPSIDLYFNNDYENYNSVNFNNNEEENLITFFNNIRNKDFNNENYKLITPRSRTRI